MRISDWSSDVCSSDLEARGEIGIAAARCERPPPAEDARVGACAATRLHRGRRLRMVGTVLSHNAIRRRAPSSLRANPIRRPTAASFPVSHARASIPGGGAKPKQALRLGLCGPEVGTLTTAGGGRKGDGGG